MRGYSVATALLAGAWFLTSVSAAGAAPCLIVTLTGTQGGPQSFNGLAGAACDQANSMQPSAVFTMTSLPTAHALSTALPILPRRSRDGCRPARGFRDGKAKPFGK